MPDSGLKFLQGVDRQGNLQIQPSLSLSPGSVCTGLAHGFNPTTGGLRSWAKERRAAGKKAEKATSAAVPLTTSSHEHSELSG